MIREAWNGKNDGVLLKTNKTQWCRIKENNKCNCGDILPFAQAHFCRERKEQTLQNTENNECSMITIVWCYGFHIWSLRTLKTLRAIVRIVIISIQDDRYDSLNNEFLLFNRCNQSSISTPEPFSPILAFTLANLTWPESALCPVALGTVLKKLYKLLLLAVTKFHGKLGLNSSPKQSHSAMRHFKKKGETGPS